MITTWTAEDLFPRLASERMALLYLLIAFDDDFVAAGVIATGHRPGELGLRNPQVLRSAVVATHTPLGLRASPEHIACALGRCLSKLRPWLRKCKDVMIVPPHVHSRLQPFDESIVVARCDMTARFRGGAGESMRRILGNHRRHQELLVEVARAVFRTPKGEERSDPGRLGAGSTSVHGAVVLTDSRAVDEIRALLAHCNLRANVVLSEPLALRGFLTPDERKGARAAVLYVGRYATHCAAFDRGGLIAVESWNSGSETRVIAAARRHAVSLNEDAIENWRYGCRCTGTDTLFDERPTFDVLDAEAAPFADATYKRVLAFIQSTGEAHKLVLDCVKVAGDDYAVLAKIREYGRKAQEDFGWIVCADINLHTDPVRRQPMMDWFCAALTEIHDAFPEYETLQCYMPQDTLGQAGERLSRFFLDTCSRLLRRASHWFKRRVEGMRAFAPSGPARLGQNAPETVAEGAKIEPLPQHAVMPRVRESLRRRAKRIHDTVLRWWLLFNVRRSQRAVRRLTRSLYAVR
jgi:hypothetical protein